MKMHNIATVLAVLLLAACGTNSNATDNTDTIATQRLVIDIEELEPPKENLPTMDYDAILRQMFSNLNIDSRTLTTHSHLTTPLVDGNMHPFFNGMHIAYAQHRPFVLSPDALWLVICQGFAQHVDHNAEALRHLFVDFEGKKTLQVFSSDISPDAPAEKWEAVFPLFTQQIARHTGDSLVSILTADFTTSTPATRAASQLTIMAAMQEYFDYEMIEICGIPQVILEGTPEDWQRIVDRTEWLRRYRLDWWVDEMLPVLRKIVLAAQGEVDQAFWRNMYKQHDMTTHGCGEPEVLCDGWIVKFFPYDDIDFRADWYKNTPPEYFRNNLQTLYDVAEDLPPEITVVPLKYITLLSDTLMLRLYAGFVGLSQDEATHALKPEIGWFIARD